MRALHRPPSTTRSAFHHPAHRRSVAVRSAPNWNPQNTPDPIVMPNPSFSATEAVEVQLKALRANDEPWTNHGIRTAYEFAADAGGMERSRYFGFSKDLYHLDHFMGMFGNMMGELIGSRSHEILSVEGEEAEAEAAKAGQGEGLAVAARVRVVGPAGGSGEYVFTLVRKELGRKAGAWMTKSLLKAQA
ncbi:hypothetical protein TSOC_011694 [Tetrabaena socialis]|uniref:Uncharacterized protein n=1 Tax=Tetrabaena socialis TaxID=47790 RepID=A0A2J7ZPZ8_9CHLO|nr:hypothetical protein TSOC_011694 [Tetrabaena socialis]|eukprot:PNH02339.1 hypothetical protein TSOC_011694 [Tetrabaena socialis]